VLKTANSGKRLEGTKKECGWAYKSKDFSCWVSFLETAMTEGGPGIRAAFGRRLRVLHFPLLLFSYGKFATLVMFYFGGFPLFFLVFFFLVIDLQPLETALWFR
jgi:hypothetical protein